MPEQIQPFVVLPGEGELIRNPVGGPAHILARAETTNGTVHAIDLEIPPGQGPPEHIHIREEEMYLLREGTLRLKADGQYFEVPAGAFVFIPRGTPHCFQNIGDGPAHLFVLFAPAGMERFFEGAATLPPGAIDTE